MGRLRTAAHRWWIGKHAFEAEKITRERLQSSGRSTLRVNEKYQIADEARAVLAARCVMRRQLGRSPRRVRTR